jgi:hypothetical protein
MECRRSMAEMEETHCLQSPCRRRGVNGSECLLVVKQRLVSASRFPL